jgi:hypothetical protein
MDGSDLDYLKLDTGGSGWVNKGEIFRLEDA